MRWLGVNKGNYKAERERGKVYVCIIFERGVGEGVFDRMNYDNGRKKSERLIGFR